MNVVSTDEKFKNLLATAEQGDATAQSNFAFVIKMTFEWKKASNNPSILL